MARKKAKTKPKAYFPSAGTPLEKDPSTPETWCAFCRAGRHDICDLAEMKFCECWREGHEEEF